MNYDLVVIGSGAGLDVASAAAQYGMKVAIVEKDRMGGTCLNRGCIPSKLLIHSADVMDVIKTASQFGIKVEKYSVDFAAIVGRVSSITDSDSEGIRRALEDSENPKLFTGEARFVSERTLNVEGHGAVSGDRILIATGTRPSIPSIRGLDGSGFITSDQALRLDRLPRVLTILGGGFIAAELAHFFGSLGSSINIIQRSARLVPQEDEEVSQKFTEIMSSKYSVYLSTEPELVEKSGETFRVSVKDRTGSRVIESDQLLIATGRIPNSDILDVSKAGVKTDERGFVVTNGYLETNVEGIYALGDAVGRYQYRHSANHEARYAFYNIANSFGAKNGRAEKVAVDYAAMPHAIFSSPQVAGAGSTEQELRSKEIPYRKSVYRYLHTAMGHALEDKDGFVKLLVQDGQGRGKILGCHILGSDASTLIHEVLVAMRSGLGVEALRDTVHIHPALSEVVARAAGQL
ncbi:MAG: dihydrolipoyl dehydrogenase [Nitrososphaera sp.]